MERLNDTLTYTDDVGKEVVARVVVAYGPDGQPTGSIRVKARVVMIENMTTEAGDNQVLDQDWNRTGLTLRNASNAQMWFNIDAPAGDGVGYPMDARRGYSFEALGMMPGGAIHIWCGTPGNDFVVMYSTESEDA